MAKMQKVDKPQISQSKSAIHHLGALRKSRQQSIRETRPRTDMRERLLAGAIELFGSRGFDSTSMRDIAAEVGIKAPAVYNHFRSKEEILVEAMTAALLHFNGVVVAADDESASALERLDGVVRRHVLYQIENARLAKANDRLLESDILNRLDSESRQRVRSVLRSYLERLSSIIEAIPSKTPRTKADIRLTALAIGTMCDHVLEWYRPNGAYSPERIASHFSAMARNMLIVP